MSGTVLKILACLAMLSDHIAAVIPNAIPGIRDVLFAIGPKEITLYYIMRSIGRTAFPIFAFLIAEGYAHTKDRRKYAVNLFLFALISEIPFNLAFSGELLYARQNVMFTLLLGYLGICCVENFRATKQKMQLLILCALFIISIFLKVDYGCFGFGFTILLHLLQQNKIIMAIIGTCLLPNRWVGGAAFIPICLYNGKRGFATGPVAKYAFYLFYPLHLLLLYIIRVG